MNWDRIGQAIERAWLWFSVAAAEQPGVLALFGLVLLIVLLGLACLRLVRGMSRRTQRTDDAQSLLAEQGVTSTTSALKLLEREVGNLRNQMEAMNKRHHQEQRDQQARHDAAVRALRNHYEGAVEGLQQEVRGLREELASCRFQLEQAMRREAAFTSAMAFLRGYLPQELADSIQDPLSIDQALGTPSSEAETR